jgi:hypothetical protein
MRAAIVELQQETQIAWGVLFMLELKRAADNDTVNEAP